MKKLVFLLAIFSVLTLNAQNYQITFSGTGASTSVTTVKVENLTSGATVTLNGTDILSLTITTGINSPEDNQPSGLRIYPNPMTDYSTLDILSPVKGDAVIIVCEMTGKPVAREKVYLENIRQSFRLTGLKSGFYLVDVKGNGFQFSEKLISNGKAYEAIKIEKDNSIIQTVNENIVKTPRKAEAIVDMVYKTGDLLKFTGVSGNYKTIITDIPTTSKTINFIFVDCRDADFNIYPVVTIGTQTWMAENLKTTKYNDGTTAITNVTDNTTWSTTTSGAYCDFSNVPTYSTTYGRLYNWYVVASTNPKNVCPTGWHVPTDAEFTTLVTYLGGETLAGGKLKETGTTHWLTPNTSATNETGFTALPGGYRSASGTFGLMGNSGFWWTSTISGTAYAFYLYLYYNSGNLSGSDNDQHTGFYVRCLKN
jgi:uncharacterized protein (TIGR02145 family)